MKFKFSEVGKLKCGRFSVPLMGQPAAGGPGEREFSIAMNASARIETRAEVGREDHFSHDGSEG